LIAVLDIKPHNHVTRVLLELLWLPVAERIQYSLCLLVHKVFVGQAPEYIIKLLSMTSRVSSQASLHVYQQQGASSVKGHFLLLHPVHGMG